jgi:putative salt-induced outer membrane protein
MKRSLFLGIAILTLSTASFAAEAFKGEAEAGAILVSGNSDSESYAAKANTSYTQEKNIYSAFGVIQFYFY